MICLKDNCENKKLDRDSASGFMGGVSHRGLKSRISDDFGSG